MTKRLGFTLVELLITLAILSLVVAALTKLFMSTNKVYHNDQAILRVQQDVRLANSLLAKDLRMLGSDAVSESDFYNTALRQCSNVYYLEEDPDEDDGYIEQDVPGSNGNGGSGRISRIELLYYDGEGELITNIKEARKIKYEVCGSPSGDIPYVSGDYEYCTESVIVTRNLHY